MLKNSFPVKLKEHFDYDIVEAAKGILILLVILGHASNFLSPEPFATFSIKYFHVACFLLLPFIYDIKIFNMDFIKTAFVRYYIPFIFFLFGYAALYFIYAQPDVDSWLTGLWQAMIFGNAPMLDASTGLRALWFMPVFIALISMIALFMGRIKTPIWALLIISFIVHITIGLVEEPAKYLFPLGLANALYLLFIGIAIRLFCTLKSKDYLTRNSHVFLLMFIMGIFLSYHFNTLIKFPVIALPDYTNFQSIIIHDLIIISAFLFLITTKLFRNFSFLKWCGKNSLSLYFTHLAFLALANTVALKLFDPTILSLKTISIVAGIFLFSLIGGVICCFIINKTPFLKNTIMPRSWNEWTPIKILNKS